MPSTPLVAQEFLELLHKSELLSEEQYAEVVSRFRDRRGLTGEVAARELVRAGYLTRFQAERLLLGRYRGFFIAHFRVQELLGSGGMGCIFIADDTRHGRTVALKVLNDAAKNDAGMLARFELEARAGARLQHPDIVRTYEVEQTSHVAYMAMEFVKGINLHELTVLHGTKPCWQACDFVMQAARGLQCAHEQGMVHRDVKPSNLLVEPTGRVRILDFGLALLDGKEDEDEFSLAMIFGHDCLGTADYMPPEQAVDSYNVDPRADVYSLGCTLYYALTGHPPYPAKSNAEKLEAHRKLPIPDVREEVPNVPEGLAAVLKKMMAKSPDDRFGSMSEVIEALQPYARRADVEFDFDRVLRIRANDTRRRMSRERKRRRRSRTGRSTIPVETGSTMSGADLGSSAARSSAARMSTVVGGDTRTSRSSVSLQDPFDSGSSVVTQEAARQIVEDVECGVPDQSFRLVPLRAGETIPLLRSRIVVGREIGCDVRLEEGGVSGRHCELQYEKNCWRVKDLDSKNGVTVNGRRVKEQLVFAGDVISFGGQVSYRLEQGATRSPESRWGWRWIVAGAVFGAALLAAVWWVFLR